MSHEDKSVYEERGLEYALNTQGVLGKTLCKPFRKMGL